MATVYDNKPARLLAQLSVDLAENPQNGSYCAGFECQVWRCEPLADHLMEWLADYALREEELRVSHTNMYVRLKEAAARVYSTDSYTTRGEVGEILLHAICRDFFGTIPFAPRVFYLTSSNDVVKSFDMVHVRYLDDNSFELWLGEAKFYEDGAAAIKAAIASVKTHIDQGFLNHEKLVLGPQVSSAIPRYREIRELLSVQTSLDSLFDAAVFPICIACDSEATAGSASSSESYAQAVVEELSKLQARLVASGLTQLIRVMLIYVPLASKTALAKAFDDRLKGVIP
jgi:hypothetical protein